MCSTCSSSSSFLSLRALFFFSSDCPMRAASSRRWEDKWRKSQVQELNPEPLRLWLLASTSLRHAPPKLHQLLASMKLLFVLSAHGKQAGLRVATFIKHLLLLIHVFILLILVVSSMPGEAGFCLFILLLPLCAFMNGQTNIFLILILAGEVHCVLMAGHAESHPPLLRLQPTSKPQSPQRQSHESYLGPVGKRLPDRSTPPPLFSDWSVCGLLYFNTDTGKRGDDTLVQPIPASMATLKLGKQRQPLVSRVWRDKQTPAADGLLRVSPCPLSLRSFRAKAVNPIVFSHIFHWSRRGTEGTGSEKERDGAGRTKREEKGEGRVEWRETRAKLVCQADDDNPTDRPAPCSLAFSLTLKANKPVMVSASLQVALNSSSAAGTPTCSSSSSSHSSSLANSSSGPWSSEEMENFILYEELGNDGSFVVYKGRRKNNLCYVAIICTDKTKKPEITNHVRLSQDLDHPNIVRFYEWFETSKHLWVIVELCTGGSLESVVTHDGNLSEDIVRRFGWDLVKGLRYIHELGIVLSDFTPAKVLLDGSGILKFSNFCLAKAEGEVLEDIFTTLSASEEPEEGDNKNMRARVQGSSTYSAPEVVQGSETSRRSDLWALGCVLYYMYSGKPPFCSDNHTELTEKILHQEPPPLRQKVFLPNPPSQEFQSLLKGLLNKNPTKRISWSELVDHPFWTQVKMEEDDAKYEEAEDVNGHKRTRSPFPTENSVSRPSSHSAISRTGSNVSKKSASSHTTNVADRPYDTEAGSQQSVTRVSGGRLNCKNSNKEVRCGKTMVDQVETRDLSQPKKGEPQPTKPYMTGNVLELKPKNGVDQDNTDTIFLLSNSRNQCSISDPSSQNSELEIVTDTDLASCVKRILHAEFDMSVTRIIDNPKILKSTPVRFDPKNLCVPAYSVEKLLSLSDDEWTGFLLQLHSCFEEKKPATPLPSSSALPQSTAVRSRLNLLCYLCCIVGHTVIADRLINSTLLSVLTQQLRQAPNWDLRSKILRTMGLLALYCSRLEEDCHVSEAVSTLTDLLRDNLRNNKLKQFLLPPLGEFLYMMSSEEEKRGSPEGLWFVPAAAYTGLMRSLREGYSFSPNLVMLQ
ncbi:hypothetical protein CCH79_00007435, partial [Gambusia affinis]